MIFSSLLTGRNCDITTSRSEALVSALANLDYGSFLTRVRDRAERLLRRATALAPDDASARKELGLFANLRPAAVFPALADASTSEPKFLYDPEMTVQEKVKEIATQIYGANDVYFELMVFPDEVHDFLVFDKWLQTWDATEDFFRRFLWDRGSR